MSNTLLLKGAFAGVLMSIFTFSASAQKLEEQQLKTNVAEISNSMDFLKSLKPVTYKFDGEKYKHLKFPGGTQYGFLSAETKDDFPELIFEAAKTYSAGKNSTSVIKYDEVKKDHLIPILVAAVKEQQEQIEQLKAELAELKTNAK
ncbi:tail fiber domain-containing protein [Pedobacter sp. PWIIR3]